jgi:hypothetical protein
MLLLIHPPLSNPTQIKKVDVVCECKLLVTHTNLIMNVIMKQVRCGRY